MTSTPFETALAVFSPDPVDPRMEVVRFERDGERVGTGYSYERWVEPIAHRQQRLDHVAAAGWPPRPGADLSGDVWEVEHRALGWDGLVPGMTGTVTITNVTQYGADVIVTGDDDDELDQLGITVGREPGDGTTGQQAAYHLRESGWDAPDEVHDGDTVQWKGNAVDTSPTLPRPSETAPAAARIELPPPQKVPDEFWANGAHIVHDVAYPDPKKFGSRDIRTLRLWRQYALGELSDLTDDLNVFDNMLLGVLSGVTVALATALFTGLVSLVEKDRHTALAQIFIMLMLGVGLGIGMALAGKSKANRDRTPAHDLQKIVRAYERKLIELESPDGKVVSE